MGLIVIVGCRGARFFRGVTAHLQAKRRREDCSSGAEEQAERNKERERIGDAMQAGAL